MCFRVKVEYFYGIFGKRGSNGIYKKNVGLLAFIPQIGSVWVGGKGGLCGGIIREGGGAALDDSSSRALSLCVTEISSVGGWAEGPRSDKNQRKIDKAARHILRPQ